MSVSIKMAETPVLVRSSTLSDTAYQLLRSAIICGSIAAGRKLRIDELSKRFSIGASPMREALARLASEGLVITEGQRGHWVAPITLDEFRDITNVRAQLECEALALSMKNGNLDWEGEVVAAFHRVSRRHPQPDKNPNFETVWAQENRRFHSTLASRADSKWLVRFTSQIYDQSERYRWSASAVVPAQSDIVDAQHRAIYEAVLAHDTKAACEALDYHIRSAAKELERRLWDL
jgi:GntR family transcriptional regulator, carbon starvation induced regulator